MFDMELHPISSEKFKQIEDIIDSGKLLGLYSIPNHRNNIHSKSKSKTIHSRNFRIEESVLANEGDCLNNLITKPTDSEITIVRIKWQDSRRCKNNKWDLHDIAVPGDGSHIAESPSLVNLVTLVGDKKQFTNEEYMVPLSSWEPTYKYEENTAEIRSSSDSKIHKSNNYTFLTNNELKSEKSDIICGRSKWAGKISKFIRKHCNKTKILDDMRTNQN